MDVTLDTIACATTVHLQFREILQHKGLHDVFALPIVLGPILIRGDTRAALVVGSAIGDRNQQPAILFESVMFAARVVVASAVQDPSRTVHNPLAIHACVTLGFEMSGALLHGAAGGVLQRVLDSALITEPSIFGI